MGCPAEKCFLATVGGLDGTDPNERVFILLMDANGRTVQRGVR